MKTALRVAALFAVYGTIGFGAEQVAALWAPEDGGATSVDVAAHEGDGAVEAAVRPEVSADIRMRHSSACSYSEVVTMTIDVDPGEVLDIAHGSGDLRVEGRADLDDVRVEATSCASESAFLDDLRMTVDEISDGIRLEAHYPERRDFEGSTTARLDVVVRIPLDMDVRVDDSSGELEVSGTGSLLIDDSSGAIRVSAVNGDLEIDDSSGGLLIEDVAGNVRVDDSSGGLSIRDVEGTVVVRDGSGGIDIAEVDAHVVIESDGSGSIEVQSVAGDLTVDRDGSGSIRYSDVGGRVDIPEDKRPRRRGGR